MDAPFVLKAGMAPQSARALPRARVLFLLLGAAGALAATTVARHRNSVRRPRIDALAVGSTRGSALAFARPAPTHGARASSSRGPWPSRDASVAAVDGQRLSSSRSSRFAFGLLARRSDNDRDAAAPAADDDDAFPRVLLIDNYDSFTYNLYHLLANAHPRGRPPLVLPNDACDGGDGESGGAWAALVARHGAFDAVVLSPGPGAPGVAADVGACARVLADPAAAGVPILGVCLGHQVTSHLDDASPSSRVTC